jgi:23S rRNA (cytosine1962-C5)-methyltransferase
LRLARDLARTLKRGNPWVFADALRSCPDAPPGAQAVLLDNKRGRPIARGFYDPTSPLAFRACIVHLGDVLDDAWAAGRLDVAWALRQSLFGRYCSTDPRSPNAASVPDAQRTTGLRLVNGEGDGVPGLVVDVFGDTAVVKLDGPAARGFWNAEGVAQWLVEKLAVCCVVERFRERGEVARVLFGPLPDGPAPFWENGFRLTADVLHGQKTGFFLDQRDNRSLIRQLAARRSVLDLFSYTGGFSVAAACGGATHVTTVDQADPAVECAREHWRLNGLPGDRHHVVVADAFDFLDQAAQGHEQWELAIIDPPSMAPSQSAVPKALAAYQRLVAGGAAVTARHGMLAMASCSSHVDPRSFLKVCEEGVAQARRRATLVYSGGQPPDHPTPLALPEFRYLKFAVLRIA